MNANDLLAELAHALHLPTLSWSPMGTASLLVDDELALNLEYDQGADRLLAWVSLGELPAQDREATCVRLLQANLLGQLGVVIGLDAARHELVASCSLDLAHADALALESALERLLGAVRQLRAEAAEAPSARATAPAPLMEDPRRQLMLRA